jgi:hypothetical protein
LREIQTITNIKAKGLDQLIVQTDLLALPIKKDGTKTEFHPTHKILVMEKCEPFWIGKIYMS